MTSQDSSPAKVLLTDVIRSEYDRVTLEGLMYQYWREDSVTAERKRIHQTWFDYRHIHPVMRSFVFVHEYNKAHQRAFKRFYGTPSGKRSDLPRGAGRGLYTRKPRTITATINRMHLIDELGCPYDTFFDAAFNHFMQERAFDEWKGNSPYLADLPLPPLQMLADAHSMISSQKAFEKRNTIRLRLPEHPHYQAENWVGTHNQKSCAKWLIDEVRNRPDRNIALARLCYEAKLIRENEVVKHLSIETVKKMRHIRDTVLSH